MRPYIFFLLFSVPLFGNVEVSIEAGSAILMNAQSGAVLFDLECYAKRFPASTTKAATAVYALKKCKDQLHAEVIGDQESIATVTSEAKKRSNYNLPPYYLESGGTHIGIKSGEKLSLSDLFYGMLLASGNDAANLIAKFAGEGSISGFMKDLNQYLEEIGCQNTHFENPHGLHHPNHFTCAYDLALIAREGLRDTKFREICSTVRYQRPQTNFQESSYFIQTNQLLKKGSSHYYSKAIGIKTGYTSHAMNNLVAAAEDKGRTLIAVLMGEKDRNRMFQDAIQLFEKAFSEKKVRQYFLRKGKQRFKFNNEGLRSPLGIFSETDLYVEYYPSEKESWHCVVQWDPVSMPIRKGTKVGQAELRSSRGLLMSAPLFALEDSKYSWTFWVEENKFYLAFFIFGAICIGVFLKQGRR